MTYTSRRYKDGSGVGYPLHFEKFIDHPLAEKKKQNKSVAVLGKNIGGGGPSSFGRQQRLSEIYYRTN